MPRRAAILAMLGVVSVAAIGTVWMVRSGDGDGLSMEVSDGITFLRNRGGMPSDTAAHAGRLSIGADGCLYVTVDEDGSTHLAAVAPGVVVNRGGLDLGERQLPIDASVTFGRENVIDEIPVDALERCRGAETAYGVN